MSPYQMMYRTIGLCLLLFVSLTQCKKIHELMTAEEIYNIFHTTPDAVPEYEVVAIEHSLHKRSSPKDFRLKFKAFDKYIDIYLNPTDGFLVGEDTPVWIAEYRYSGQVHYRRLKNGIMKEVLGVYQSLPGRAALVVRAREDESLKFDGTIEDLSVIPLSDSLQAAMNGSNKRKRDVPRGTRSIMKTEYHIVYKSNKMTNQTNTVEQLDKTVEENTEEFLKKVDASRTKRANTDIVFPTILATTDFDVAVKSGEDSEYYDQLIYQLAFWNAVDLKYRHLSNPKVRLRIAGFVIGSGRESTPYLYNNIVDGEVKIYDAIDDMRTYWGTLTNREISAKGYHILTTATNLKLFGRDQSGRKTNYGGLARVNSFCFDYGGTVFYPSMIFNDDLGFGSINVAVHELAHVLGAYHDDQTNGKCSGDDGYLMSPIVSTTVNNPVWSKCSLEKLSMTLRYKSCGDKPREHYPPGKPLDKILPGTLKTIEEQCQARGFHWACDAAPDICTNLRCWNSGFVSFFTTLLRCQDSASAAEGTECAPGRVCIDGVCQSLYPLESQ